MTSGGNVGTFWGSEAVWEVAATLADSLVPVVVVSITFAGDDRPMWAVCEPGDPPRPLCRHEHLYQSVALCPEAQAERRRLDGREQARRIALLPAPAGARYVSHCTHYWPADMGGACPTCGQPGAPLVPEAKVERAQFDRGMWWIHAKGVSATSVAVDLGVAGLPCAEAMGDSLLVRAAAVPDPAAILAAAGWSVAGAPKRKGVAA